MNVEKRRYQEVKGGTEQKQEEHVGGRGQREMG